MSLDIACNHIGLDVWHRRIDHMPFQRMKLLPLNFAIPANTEYIPCDICPKARQHRFPFPSSIISTLSLFELIHIDTWGPYHARTYSGLRFS